MENENAKIQAEAAKKSAKIVTVDPSKIVDDDGNPVDLMNTSALRQWLKQRYSGQEVEVQDNGRIVRFTKRGLADSMKRRGEAQRQAYADLINLLANSIYAGYESGDVKHPNVDRQEIYYAAARIGDGTYGIRFKLDVGEEGKRGLYKDHKTIKVEKVEKISIKKPPSPYRGFSPHGTEDGQTMPILKIQEAMGITCNIDDSNSKVNSNNKNY